jgi:ATP-dependent RNA helicase A
LERFAFDNFCHIGAFKSLLKTTAAIGDILKESGLISSESTLPRGMIGGEDLNRNSDNMALIKALIVAGLDPNLAATSGGITYRSPSESYAMIHPSSLLYQKPRKLGTKRPTEPMTGHNLLAYSNMVKSSDGRNIFLRDVTSTTPLVAALFGGKTLNLEEKNLLNIDNWLGIFLRGASFKSPEVLTDYRAMLHRALSLAFHELSMAKGSTLGERPSINPVIDYVAASLVHVLNIDEDVRKIEQKSSNVDELFGDDEDDWSRMPDQSRYRNTGRKMMEQLDVDRMF